MRREKIGVVGGAYAEVMPVSNWHPDILTAKLGPQCIDLSITELIKFHRGVSREWLTGDMCNWGHRGDARSSQNMRKEKHHCLLWFSRSR